jgi:hypothetical protein
MVDFMICHQNLKILYGNGHIFFIQQSKLDKDKWNVMDECHCFLYLITTNQQLGYININEN